MKYSDLQYQARASGRPCALLRALWEVPEAEVDVALPIAGAEFCAALFVSADEPDVVAIEDIVPA